MHKWSSLICSVFLLLICLTGLPLLFAEQIDNFLHPETPYDVVPADSPRANLDQIARLSREMFPNEVVTSMFIDDDEPQIVVGLARSWEVANADPDSRHFVRFDAHTAKVLEKEEQPGEQNSITDIALRLHRDLFAGLPGELFMGAMGVCFLIALVSGVILYSPFMQKLDFGVIRKKRSRFIQWLDLHNFLGIVILVWMSVVGLTGVMNELSTPLFAIWRQTDVKQILAAFEKETPPRDGELVSLQAAYDVASSAQPAMSTTGIVFPGDADGSPNHFVFWARGRTPLTSRLYSPLLVDARTGALTAIISMPWYLRVLELCRPLHFGDYGGMPLKIIWALLDIIAIVVIGSGIYLWFSRYKSGPAGFPLEELAG
jgi:uncharacterized iron-regulated membrane protein